MNNNETMSREEIMRAIEEGDRYAGVLMEEIDGKVDVVLEDNDRLDKKIGAVDAKLEDFRREANGNFNIVFEEMRAMRREFEGRFEAMDENFSARFEAMDHKFSKQFEDMDEKFSAKFESMDEKFSKRFDTLEKIRQ